MAFTTPNGTAISISHSKSGGGGGSGDTWERRGRKNLRATVWEMCRKKKKSSVLDIAVAITSSPKL